MIWPWTSSQRSSPGALPPCQQYTSVREQSSATYSNLTAQKPRALMLFQPEFLKLAPGPCHTHCHAFSPYASVNRSSLLCRKWQILHLSSKTVPNNSQELPPCFPPLHYLQGYGKDRKSVHHQSPWEGKCHLSSPVWVSSRLKYCRPIDYPSPQLGVWIKPGWSCPCTCCRHRWRFWQSLAQWSTSQSAILWYLRPTTWLAEKLPDRPSAPSCGRRCVLCNLSCKSRCASGQYPWPDLVLVIRQWRVWRPPRGCDSCCVCRWHHAVYSPAIPRQCSIRLQQVAGWVTNGESALNRQSPKLWPSHDTASLGTYHPCHFRARR